jgi:levanase/fructan beta-fructosidase
MKTRLLQILFLFNYPLFLLAQDNNIETPQWRPVYHFTPAKNWTNDPNGLIYVDGVYHLYNQQNPFENKWGHMSWGHATSQDLIHWTHLPIAIPEKIDKDTTWIFSGCAVLDKNNTSGFCKNGGCIVAIYTADQPNLKKESQFIAYSNDGGMTYTNYEKNPVIDLQRRDFRDPNVIWLKDQNKWLMTVALPRERKVRFYSSANLKDWQLLSEFGGNEGDIRRIWECPSLTPLPVDGDPSKTKWLLMVSSGNQDAETGMQYFIGDFDGKTFTNNYSADNKMFVDYGSTYYAAIPWNNLPDDKHVMIGWLVPTRTETYPWRGQMSIPRDMSLKTTTEGIKLFQQPSLTLRDVLSKLPSDKTIAKQNVEVNNQEIILNTQTAFNANANWIDAEFSLGSATDFGFKLGQQKDNNGKVTNEIVLGYNTKSNTLYIGHNVDGLLAGTVQTVNIKPINNKIKLEVLFDKSSLEVFANDGEKVITALVFPDKDATQFSLFAKDGNIKANNLKIWDLSE